MTEKAPEKPAAAPSAEPPTKTRALSLRTRWTLSFVLAGSVPLALLGFATLGIQRAGLLNSEEKSETAITNHVADVIAHDIQEAADATHRVGLVLTDGRITDDEAKLSLAQEMMANAAVLARVTIYLPDGTLVDSIIRKRETPGPNPPDRVPTVEILPGRDGAWLPAEYAPSGAVLRYLEAVKRDGQLRAYVLATLRPNALSEKVSEISRERFDNNPEGILLLDEAGKILASGAPTGSALAVSQSLLAKDILSVVHLQPPDFLATAVYSKPFVAGGEDMVGTVQTIPARHWAVAVRRPASIVLSSLAQSRRSLAIVGGGFLLLALIVSAVLVARTVKPIQALMRLAIAYGKREFGARSEVRTGDEIELLGNQMMGMADNISAGEKEIARRAQVESNLARFMPAAVAHGIASGEKAIALGGERRKVTVLFADVSSFTPFAEGTDPERVVAFLNELFGVMTEVVFKYDGTVDKFIGDCVMAVFGAPTAMEDHVQRALSTAEDMQRFVESSGAKWKARYGIEPKLAIGINTGEALVGNLGSESRMEYTCVGDVVNVAARLEGMAQAGQTLVTQEVVDVVGEDYEFNSLGEHPLRGKKNAVALYELVR